MIALLKLRINLRPFEVMMTWHGGENWYTLLRIIHTGVKTVQISASQGLNENMQEKDFTATKAWNDMLAIVRKIQTLGSFKQDIALLFASV